jgi:hypothetical protein
MRNPNAISIRRDFREHDVEHRGGVDTVIQRKFGSDQHTVLEHLTINDGTGVAEFERRARIYTAAELAVALRAAGLTVDGHYANAMGEPFEAGSSPRIITVGRKAT